MPIKYVIAVEADGRLLIIPNKHQQLWPGDREKNAVFISDDPELVLATYNLLNP